MGMVYVNYGKDVREFGFSVFPKFLILKNGKRGF